VLLWAKLLDEQSALQSVLTSALLRVLRMVFQWVRRKVPLSVKQWELRMVLQRALRLALLLVLRMVLRWAMRLDWPTVLLTVQQMERRLAWHLGLPTVTLLGQPSAMQREPMLVLPKGWPWVLMTVQLKVWPWAPPMATLLVQQKG